MTTQEALGLGSNRVIGAIEAMRGRLDGFDASRMTTLRSGFMGELTLEEIVAYNNARALGQANGRLSHAESQTVYALLGSTGWRPTADLASRIVVTQLMGELMGVHA